MTKLLLILFLFLFSLVTNFNLYHTETLNDCCEAGETADFRNSCFHFTKLTFNLTKNSICKNEYTECCINRRKKELTKSIIDFALQGRNCRHVLDSVNFLYKISLKTCFEFELLTMCYECLDGRGLAEKSQCSNYYEHEPFHTYILSNVSGSMTPVFKYCCEKFVELISNDTSRLNSQVMLTTKP